MTLRMEAEGSVISIRDELRDALRRLEGEDDAIAAIVKGAAPDWRNQLVKARRSLASAIGDFTVVVGKAERELKMAPGAQVELHTRLSKFRHALAMHQAVHSAIILTAEDAEYRASSTRTRQQALALYGFTRTTFGLGS